MDFLYLDPFPIKFLYLWLSLLYPSVSVAIISLASQRHIYSITETLLGNTNLRLKLIGFKLSGPIYMQISISTKGNGNLVKLSGVGFELLNWVILQLWLSLQ